MKKDKDSSVKDQEDDQDLAVTAKDKDWSIKNKDLSVKDRDFYVR